MMTFSKILTLKAKYGNPVQYSKQLYTLFSFNVVVLFTKEEIVLSVTLKHPEILIKQLKYNGKTHMIENV